MLQGGPTVRIWWCYQKENGQNGEVYWILIDINVGIITRSNFCFFNFLIAGAGPVVGVALNIVHVALVLESTDTLWVSSSWWIETTRAEIPKNLKFKFLRKKKKHNLWQIYPKLMMNQWIQVMRRQESWPVTHSLGRISFQEVLKHHPSIHWQKCLELFQKMLVNLSMPAND